ncbi:meiotic recombination protein spo11 [Aspergillus nomiae NRRL 13137]|uniref:DNA topoisomerase (ATP-hydrolyzing) n=1 Tax=Aspergillus nomiae NRRL (strain ATCC 15546 / NRRL 13137 / CBS 260.88 / M93) TaxID=1509407 RepID=A0A0L1JAL1_ASPN3|nr:meiotic recombination protein spo11 [Aspergillus nomiae NRRL 13137]KNG88745.1 meiotic recombination protein spo11 [Aspergillus nomiae NRRL 13137]
MELDLPQDNDMSTSLRLVKRYVNETLASALDELSTPDGRPTITLKRRSRNVSLFISPTSRALESNGADTYITYSWPGANAFEAWKFSIYIILLATLPRVLVLIVMTIAIVFRVLAVVADAIDTGLLVSKSDPVCFGTQKVVDAIIDDLAYTIGVDRSALNIEAAAKGLVTGYCSLLTKYGETMDLRLPDKDCLVPSSQDNGEIDISDASWVLIIEKEVLQLPHNLVTNTHLVHRPYTVDLQEVIIILERPQEEGFSSLSDKILPFYGLVDSDPDGMAIMSTYKYGSMAHTNQNGRLNIPCLCWLGLRTSDVVSGAPSNDDGALIRLTARDRKKIMTMLSNSPVWAAEGPELEWRAELQQMLMLNLKAEIEILYDWDGGLEGWIDQKMAGFSPSDN